MKKIIALLENAFDDLEFWYPVLRLKEENFTVHIVAEKENKKYFGKYGVPAISGYSFDKIDPDEYDGILIPGGWAPDKLRRYENVLKIVRNLFGQNKIIGQICHGPWVSISAGILRGKIVTSTPGIKDDIKNAGGEWVDEPFVVDGNIVSGRRPMDLPFYIKQYIMKIKEL